MEGLAIAPDGELFGTNRTGDLFRISTTTGSADLVGFTGVGAIIGLDFLGETLLASDGQQIPMIWSIDTTTAESTHLVTVNRPIGMIRSLAVLDVNTVLVTADYNPNTGSACSDSGNCLVEIDLTTGFATFVGDLAIGAVVSGLDFGADGNLYGTDWLGGLWQIDPSDASRVNIVEQSSFDNRGTGLATQNGLTAGEILVTVSDPADSSSHALLRVVPSTGDRTLVASSAQGTFSNPGGLLIEPNGTIIVAIQGLTVGDPTLIRVDPVVGTTTTLAVAGPNLLATDVALESSRFMVVGSTGSAIWRFDLATNSRVVLSGSDPSGGVVGSGPYFQNPRRIAVSSDGSILVSSTSSNEVFRVDPISGDRVIVSSAEVGSGPELRYPRGIAIEVDGSIVVTRDIPDALLRIDPTTGDRTVISSSSAGQYFRPNAVAIDSSGDILTTNWAPDSWGGGVMRVDPSTGARTLVSGASVGIGPSIAFANGIAIVVDPDDLDGDGVLNSADNCPLTPNEDQADQDGDGLGDVCDPDIDGDGVANDIDNCPATANPDQADQDADGFGDVCDADIDEDGVLNAADNCPTTPNAGQEDLDGDWIGDACDPDVDGDTVPNETDNCPRTFNPDQTDVNGDGFGDACVAPDVTVPPGTDVGDGTIIEPGVELGSGVTVGEDSTIEEGAIVDSGASVGSDTTVGAGASLNQGSSVGDDTTVAPGAEVQKDADVGNEVYVGQDAVIQFNVEIGDAVCIGDGTRIGAGSTIEGETIVGQNVNIGKFMTIGLGSVIGDNQEIKKEQVVVAGSVIGGPATCP
jgi:carbonic anhydrase/acetyltransferase-like protein (isoleucine patch superfamily)/streptogramin lyase